jgi:hypothetical protein
VRVGTDPSGAQAGAVIGRGRCPTIGRVSDSIDVSLNQARYLRSARPATGLAARASVAAGVPSSRPPLWSRASDPPHPGVLTSRNRVSTGSHNVWQLPMAINYGTCYWRLPLGGGQPAATADTARPIRWWRPERQARAVCCRLPCSGRLRERAPKDRATFPGKRAQSRGGGV